jgi:RNA polymerase sigma-70 factor (ECF subfamily)
MASGSDGGDGDGSEIAKFHEVAASGSDVHDIDKQRQVEHRQAGRRDAADDSAGDVGDFEAIAERHKPYLHQKALSLSGDAETAKDLVQDALLRAFQNFGKFQQGTNARAWLVKILTRRYLDLVKHRRVVNNASVQLAQIPESGEYEPSFIGISDDQLFAAIQQLDPRQREVIDCCYFKGMKYREAAKKLGVPSGTIGTRLKAAVDRLKAILTRASIGKV